MFKTILRLTVRSFAVIGLLVVGLIVGGLWAARNQIHQAPKPPEEIVLVLNLRQPLLEKSEALPHSLRALYDVMTQEDDQLVLHDIVNALRRAARDPRVKGMVALFGDNLPPFAQAQEIRAALAKFRAAGKFSYAFSPSYGDFGPGNQAYYLAAAFEQVWLQPVGMVGLSGLRIEHYFARNALEKLGVTPNILQREEYKSAFAMITETTMPAPMREEMTAVMNALNDQLVAGIAETRSLPAAEVAQLMAQGPYTAKEALDKKLIDKIGYGDELETLLDEKAGKDAEKMGAAFYLTLPEPTETKKPAEKPAEKTTSQTTPPVVALIIGEGQIDDSGGRPSPLTGGEASMNAHEIASAFEAAAKDDEVKLILFRVESPGGSPTASETIRRALIMAQKKGKKVLVSMGQMAGSGGYWIAMNADRIFANPATLTGSIGVLGGKFDLSGLYQKLGVTYEALSTGETTGLWSMSGGYSPLERQRMDALLDDTYNSFRNYVAEARKIPAEKLPALTKGRIFTGAQALQLGLVDELGGMHAAVDYAKQSLGLKPEERLSLKPFPQPLAPAERVRDMLHYLFKSEVSMGDLFTLIKTVILEDKAIAENGFISATMPRFHMR
jgi:protease IV